MEPILFSTGCPKCKILKKKLGEKGVRFVENNSIDDMLGLGMLEAPALMVGAKLFGFADAIRWVNEQEDKASGNTVEAL